LLVDSWAYRWLANSSLLSLTLHRQFLASSRQGVSKGEGEEEGRDKDKGKERTNHLSINFSFSFSFRNLICNYKKEVGLDF